MHTRFIPVTSSYTRIVTHTNRGVGCHVGLMSGARNAPNPRLVRGADITDPYSGRTLT
jgi:hypothetical protein